MRYCRDEEGEDREKGSGGRWTEVGGIKGDGEQTMVVDGEKRMERGGWRGGLR